jgi:hypothetical protein
MNSHQTNINVLNWSLKYSTADFFADQTGEITSQNDETIAKSICPSERSPFSRGAKIKSSTIKYTYDNMGYG